MPGNGLVLNGCLLIYYELLPGPVSQSAPHFPLLGGFPIQGIFKFPKQLIMGPADELKGRGKCHSVLHQGLLQLTLHIFRNLPGWGFIRGIIWFGTLLRIIAGSGRGPSGGEDRKS